MKETERKWRKKEWETVENKEEIGNIFKDHQEEGQMDR